MYKIKTDLISVPVVITESYLIEWRIPGYTQAYADLERMNTHALTPTFISYPWAQKHQFNLCDLKMKLIV